MYHQQIRKKTSSTHQSNGKNKDIKSRSSLGTRVTVSESSEREWGSITNNVMRTQKDEQDQPEPISELNSEPVQAKYNNDLELSVHPKVGSSEREWGSIIKKVMRTQQINDDSISSVPQTEGRQLRATIPTVAEPSRPPVVQLKAPKN